MNQSTDEQSLTFARFIEKVVPNCICHNSISLINPQTRYEVKLLTKIKIGKEYVQSFDETYLQPMAQKLGLNLTKMAKMVALRNAWIANIQNGEISLTLLNSNEIVQDYIVLTSSRWLEHLHMRGNHLGFTNNNNCVSSAESLFICQWDHWYKEQEGGIWHAINESRLQKDKKIYSSELELNADLATNDIKLAKKKIHDLLAAIEEQEAIIGLAKRHVHRFYNNKDVKNKKAPGHPKISEFEDRQQRHDVAMNFLEQWVNSLMSNLSVASCGELARVVGGNRMTWGKWLKKEMLPLSSSLEALLDVKIKSGEHQNTKLRDVKTSPSLDDLITLVTLV